MLQDKGDSPYPAGTAPVHSRVQGGLLCCFPRTGCPLHTALGVASTAGWGFAWWWGKVQPGQPDTKDNQAIAFMRVSYLSAAQAKSCFTGLIWKIAGQSYWAAGCVLACSVFALSWCCLEIPPPLAAERWRGVLLTENCFSQSFKPSRKTF